MNHYNSTIWCQSIKSPLVEAMTKLDFDSEDSVIIQADIFDLLLASAAHVDEPCNKHTQPPVLCSLYFDNVECLKKLIQRGSRLGRTSYGDNYVWAEIV